MIYTIVIVLLVFLDQLVKYLVKTHIPLGGQVGFLPHILGLTHIQNTGAAFSMLEGARWFFVVLTILFVLFALWALYTNRIAYALGRWTAVLVIAGAIGNLIDRALYGYVVDMFQTLFMRFAIFNVADIFVVVGGILFCLYYGFFRDKWLARDGKGEQHDDHQ